MTETCFICEKHANNDSDLFINFDQFNDFKVGHVPDRSGTGEVYLGALLIEPIRHVENWSELSEEEAIQLGGLIKEVHKLLYQDNSVEHVYTWVFGDAVNHMHIWLVPRYTGTPREYWGVKLDEWHAAPKGGSDEIKRKVAFLRSLKHQM